MEKDMDESKHDKEEKLSVCDIMKEDTSKIIKKMESQMPSMFQNYSDLYTAYLHMFDDLFGTCYIAEKEFFDKLNTDQGILQQIKENSETVRRYYTDNIDMMQRSFDEYVKMRIDAIKSFDRYVHTMMEAYTKTLSQFNKSTKT